jgi:peptidoglycan/LPS O-acetylase OafA/YrhL
MRTKPAWVTCLLLACVALCLFLGFWAFAYQGYTEDAGSAPIQSWPYGAALFAAAGALIVLTIRRARPDLSGGSLLRFTALVIGLLVLAALASLDAGGHSFEF